jgi:HTH-type transcriptional regulator/antitoxin HigA
MTKIDNEEQYNALMQRIETLLPLVNDSTPTTDPNYIEFEMLGNLVADYEEAHYSLGKPSLMGLIKLRMYETGITVDNLASFLGLSSSKTEDFINGKAEPTLAFGKVISQKLNIAPETVLGLA